MPFPVVVLFPNSAQYIFSAPSHSSRLPYFGYGLHVTILFFVFHSQAASLSHSIPIAEEQQDSKEMGQCVLFGKRTIKNSTRTSDSTSIPKISPAIAIYFDKWKIVPISANEITFMELLYCPLPSHLGGVLARLLPHNGSGIEMIVSLPRHVFLASTSSYPAGRIFLRGKIRAPRYKTYFAGGSVLAGRLLEHHCCVWWHARIPYDNK